MTMTAEQMDFSLCGRAALEYLERDWSIFPVGLEKKPLVKWGEYQTVRPDEGSVREWWTHWPEAGIGLACGPVSGVVVLDVDDEQGLQELQRRGWRLPRTLTAKTGRGGHYYFRDPGVRTRNFAGGKRTFPLPHIDFRGQGAT